MKDASCLLKTAIVAAGLAAVFANSAAAELYINELFFDPGGAGQDNRDEYIELRGTPEMSLANHYLIVLENENNEFNTGNPGAVENFFDLGAVAVGSNGFLTMRQRNNLYDGSASGTTDLVNTGTGAGWGSGGSSSVGHTGEDGKTTLENSGFTAMLIRNDGDPFLNQPFVGLDLDVDNDGLDPVETAQFGWRENWTIIDSIGVFSEFGEAFYGRTYGQVNFGPEIPGQETFPGGPVMHNGNVEDGAVYVGLGYEVEHIARWGNSTGQMPDDWHITNSTDNPGSGSMGVPDFRQSCIDGTGCHAADDGNPNTPPPQPPGGTESNKGVPYGVKLTTTLGAPNLLLGDYSQNGVVDAADYVVWRESVDATANETGHHPADGDHSFVVDEADYAVWRAHFGAPFSGTGVGAFANASIDGQSSVPEPISVLSSATGGLVLAVLRRRR